MVKVDIIEMKEVLKRIKAFASNSFTVVFTKEKAAEGKLLARITATNAVSQATAAFRYVTEESPVTEKTVIFSSSLSEMVDLISSFGGELYIQLSDSSAQLKCGTATVPVPLLSEGMSLESPVMESGKFLQLKVTRSAFCNLIQQGAAASNDSTQPVLDATISYSVKLSDSGEPKLCLCSCNGFSASKYEVSAECFQMDVLNQWCKDNVNVVTKSAFFNTLAKRSEGADVTFFFTPKQVVLSDGVDLYAFTCLEQTYPVQVAQLYDKASKDAPGFKCGKSELKKALSLVTFGEDPCAKLSFKDDKLVVSNNTNTKVVELPITDKSGEIMVCMNVKMALKITDNYTGETLSFSSENPNKPIYIKSQDPYALAWLLPISTVNHN